MTTTPQRIEYIDVTRGFSMLLVVIWHVVFYSYHEGAYTFNTYSQAIFKFFMPLFFFISGFVQSKLSIYTMNEVGQILIYIKAKFLALVIPTLCFLIIYDIFYDLPIIASFFHSLKQGYWFTLVLFEFIVIYLILSFIIHKIQSQIAERIIWSVALICTLFAPEAYKILHHIVPVCILNLFSVNQFHFFIFFWGGVQIRKHSSRFYKLTDNGFIIAIILFAFIIDLVVSNKLQIALPSVPFVLIDKTRYIISGACGSIIVFTFFRMYKDSFTRNTQMGSWLQCIGKRTLDVYLLHYFFLPRNLEIIGQFFKTNSNPSIEFLVSLLIAIWVVFLCIVISKVIRLSGFLERYLFGVKPKISI